ncbi:hypothetical protein I7I53_12008 [Histoplasma capsulatum var. duboisii H88]|uniref:Uncharacterized protein n=1 Tax=Ajellomyces capsulatus (strain H88) TaxID=544711 RepID=A0A8A1LUZ2_AJEC8|nr:hypothetical protein I7I53_12008 [Histoplasma capsulatum var. duboisii H88]
MQVCCRLDWARAFSVLAAQMRQGVPTMHFHTRTRHCKETRWWCDGSGGCDGGDGDDDDGQWER